MSEQERRGEALIPATAFLVVAAITALAWGLSYTALRSLARRHGWPDDGFAGWPASAWPLVIDLFMLASGLIAVEARRCEKPDGYAWALTVFYSAALVSGNVLPVWPDPVGVAMHAAPGVTLIFGWHLLLRRLRPEKDTTTLPLSKPERASSPAQATRSPRRSVDRSALERVRRYLADRDPRDVMPGELVKELGISNATAGRCLKQLRQPFRPGVVA